MWEKCSSCAQQIWFLCFLFQNNLLHIASSPMSSPSWLQSLSQFWTGSWVGSLMSHDIAELVLQLYTLPSKDHIPPCYVPHILYTPHKFQVKKVLFLPVTFLTVSMSIWMHFTSSYECSTGQQFVKLHNNVPHSLFLPLLSTSSGAGTLPPSTTIF
jgi:hypothetical protein